MSNVIDIATRRPIVSPEAETIFRSCEPTEGWAMVYGKGIGQLLIEDYPSLSDEEGRHVARACADYAFEAFVGKGCTDERADELAEIMFWTMIGALVGMGGAA
ncbi:hypothetical protein [Kaistia terrae]|uniref:Uncharacterized protein n=1 Tax=Kaistia terrae TaxID=537017 RepID=A0ABW0PVD8_9HYPH|nr:hypothetical protein [Kaistia terrae]MCX5579444.1 hypothetical protein [Kaistia terrae]